METMSKEGQERGESRESCRPSRKQSEVMSVAKLLLEGTTDRLKGLLEYSEEMEAASRRKNSKGRVRIDLVNEEGRTSRKVSEDSLQTVKVEEDAPVPKIEENAQPIEDVEGAGERQSGDQVKVKKEEPSDVSRLVNITFGEVQGNQEVLPSKRCLRLMEEWMEQDDDCSTGKECLERELAKNVQQGDATEERHYGSNPFYLGDEIPVDFDRLFLNKRLPTPSQREEDKQTLTSEVTDPVIKAIVENEEETGQEAMMLYGSFLNSKYNRHKLNLAEFRGETYVMYTREEKRVIIRFAKRHGAEVASRVMNISKQKVIRYVLIGEQRKKGGGRKILSPVLDSMLLQWIQNHRDDPDSVKSSYYCLQKAKEIAQQIGFVDFKGSQGWLANFRKRHCDQFKMPLVKLEDKDKSV